MYCKATVNNGSVVIYYGVDGIMRFPTGVTISKDKDKQNRFKEWDYKKEKVRPEVKQSTQSNRIIDDLLKYADDLVSRYLSDGIKITANELKKELAEFKTGKVQKKTSLFLPNYLNFQESKRRELIERDNKSDTSFKTYQTFYNTIIDYQIENNAELKVADVAKPEWLEEFHSWLTKERPKDIALPSGEIHIFKSKGLSKPATIDKRFEVLTGCFAYFKSKKLIESDEFLRKYKSKQITIIPKIKTTLTIDEIHKLYNHGFNDDTKEKVKLLFLFSCLTGFRWADIELFDKAFIEDFKGRKIYKHRASKTRGKTSKVATIPLSDLALEILEKLEFNLKRFSNGYTNLTLHELLKESNIFNDLTLSEDAQTGRKQHRYELLSMHRGRDTFITNLIGIVPLHELMSYTSHEKLSTLQKYIDHSRDINPDYVTIFDRP